MGGRGRDYNSYSTREKIRNQRGLRTSLEVAVSAGEAGTSHSQAIKTSTIHHHVSKCPHSTRDIDTFQLGTYVDFLASVPMTSLPAFILALHTWPVPSYSLYLVSVFPHTSSSVPPFPLLPFPPNSICHNPSHSSRKPHTFLVRIMNVLSHSLKGSVLNVLYTVVMSGSARPSGPGAKAIPLSFPHSTTCLWPRQTSLY